MLRFMVVSQENCQMNYTREVTTAIKGTKLQDCATNSVTVNIVRISEDLERSGHETGKY